VLSEKLDTPGFASSKVCRTQADCLALSATQTAALADMRRCRPFRCPIQIKRMVAAVAQRRSGILWGILGNR
jgi:hypothetical protein